MLKLKIRDTSCQQCDNSAPHWDLVLILYQLSNYSILYLCNRKSLSCYWSSKNREGLHGGCGPMIFTVKVLTNTGTPTSFLSIGRYFGKYELNEMRVLDKIAIFQQRLLLKSPEITSLSQASWNKHFTVGQSSQSTVKVRIRESVWIPDHQCI